MITFLEPESIHIEPHSEPQHQSVPFVICNNPDPVSSQRTVCNLTTDDVVTEGVELFTRKGLQ